MTKGLKTPALAEGADREHCVSVRGGKVHEVTEWDDQGPDYVFPLCRTGSMTNSGTKYRKTTADLSCTNCVANRERRRARQAEEAAAAQAPSVEEPAAVEEAPVAELDEWAARLVVAPAWSAADDFQAKRTAEGELLGFTFQVGLPHNARYGWIAADGTYGDTLKRDRAQAAALIPAAREEAPAPAAQEDVTEPQRYTAEFETVQAHPGHQENRLTIRVLGEADPVEFYALPHIPGWTTDGFLRAFGWRAIEPGGLTYLGARRESGAVRRTVASVSQVVREAQAALREEIVARMTVRLSNGAAGHFLPVFRTGRAYPIGWTYRIGYADAALYGWVTAGGALPDGGGVHTREAAEQELRQQDPAAPPSNGDLYGHVSGCSLWDLGRRFLAARNGELTGLPAHLTDGAPITAKAARELVQRSYSQAEQFEPLQGQGGRMLGWTFRAGRLHSSRYGWVTAAGTVSKGLEPYRSTAGNVLVHADADDREAAERAAVVRSMGGRRLADNRCVHNRYAREDVQGDPVLACSMAAEGDTFGVFDSAGERYDTHPCAVQAANDAARSGGWDDAEGADPQPYWAKLCPAHPFEVAGRCSSCGQDTPDEDAEGAADPTYVHLRTGDVAEAVRTVHPDAHTFQRFDSPVGAVRVTGWTFRTGHGAGARYGVVTAAGQVSGVGLYEYRTTAERAYLNGYGQDDTGRS